MLSLVTISTLAIFIADAKPALLVPAVKHSGPNAAAVALSVDGTRVAAGYGGDWIPGTNPMIPRGRIFVWDRKTGKQLHRFKQIGDILRVEFSADGQYLAYNGIYTPGDSIHARQVVLVDLKKGEAIRKWESDSFAFSPVKNHLLIGVGNKIEVLEIPSLNTVRSIQVSSPRVIAVSADGKSGAALGTFWQANRGFPDGLYLFGLEEDKAPRIRNGENLHKAQSLAFSPDGKQIVTGHDGGEARIWSSADLEAKPKLQRIDTPLAVFPLYLDEKTLGLVTQPANGSSWAYDKAAPSGFKIEKGKTPPWADLYRFEVNGAEPEPVIWRFQDASYSTHYARFGTTRGTPEANSRRYVLSRDAKTLVVGCNGCSVIDAATGKIERSYQGEE
jgi:hypothetical protein